jgi:hypothetical protein
MTQKDLREEKHVLIRARRSVGRKGGGISVILGLGNVKFDL